MNPLRWITALSIAAGIAFARRLRYDLDPGDIEFMFPMKKQSEPKHHYEISLTPPEREALLALLDEDKLPSVTMRRYVADKVRNARRHDGPPLPDAVLPWAEVEREAERQGCSPADVLYDRARAHE